MSALGQPRVVYVSYDGAGEPLGRSQVVAYLRRLAPDCRITLISFEKEWSHRAQTAALLEQAGIRWVPLQYHKRPPVFSTLADMIAGATSIRRAVRADRAEIVHVRSLVPAVMALISAPLRRRRRWRFLFDIRGFWADERVLGGAMRENGLIHRLARWCELWCFREADAVVTLAGASAPVIRTWMRSPELPLSVIPTCADVEQYGGGTPGGGGPRAVWCGSVGTFYRFDLAVRFARALRLPLLVLTRQVDGARAQLGDLDADVREVPQSQVAAELRPGDIGMCFYADGFANLARAPTRFAEYLAAGMTVAATAGVGDLDTVIREHEVGVVLTGDGDAELEAGARRARELAADTATAKRGRRIARERYSVSDGTRAYLELYRVLQGVAPSAPSMSPAGQVAPRSTAGATP